MAHAPVKHADDKAQDPTDTEDTESTLALRLAHASAVQSPLLFRVLSPLLNPVHRLESSLHSFILVDLLHIFGIPKGLSSLALLSAASVQLHRAYVRQPKVILAALALYNPLNRSLKAIDALCNQMYLSPSDHAGLLAWWLIYGSLSLGEAIKVRPLISIPTSPGPSASSTYSVGLARIRLALARRAPHLARYLPNISLSSATVQSSDSSKSKLSILKRTFGPQWPLFKLLVLLLLQHSGGKPALALVRWLIQPLKYVLSVLLRRNTTNPPKVLKVVYEEVSDDQTLFDSIERTPRRPKTHKPKGGTSRDSSVDRDHDWTRASAVLDSGVLSTEVWNSPNKKLRHS